MNRNTQEERELLSELMVITDLIKGVEKGTRTNVTAEENGQLNVILSKIRETYPTVKFPINLNNSCGTCVKDFIESLIPVYNRVYMQQLEAELSVVEPEIVIGSVEYNKGNVNEEVKEVKKTVTRKKK